MKEEMHPGVRESRQQETPKDQGSPLPWHPGRHAPLLTPLVDFSEQSEFVQLLILFLFLSLSVLSLSFAIIYPSHDGGLIQSS